MCATDWVEKMPRRKQKNTKRNATSVDVLLGKKIRARRMEMGVTQSDLAGALGVSFQQIQKYERGVNRIGAGRLHQIAAKLEIDVSYFMSDIDGKISPTISRFANFMATKDGADICDAMIKLDAPHRRAVIDLARTLSKAYGIEA